MLAKRKTSQPWWRTEMGFQFWFLPSFQWLHNEQSPHNSFANTVLFDIDKNDNNYVTGPMSEMLVRTVMKMMAISSSSSSIVVVVYSFPKNNSTSATTQVAYRCETYFVNFMTRYPCKISTKLGTDVYQISDWHWWKGFQGQGQRSRSYVYKCVNAVTAKACISTMWCWSLLVCFDSWGTCWRRTEDRQTDGRTDSRGVIHNVVSCKAGPHNSNQSRKCTVCNAYLEPLCSFQLSFPLTEMLARQQSSLLKPSSLSPASVDYKHNNNQLTIYSKVISRHLNTNAKLKSHQISTVP